jgi:hypothetical protein
MHLHHDTSVFLDWDSDVSRSGCLRIQGYIIETISRSDVPPVAPVVLNGTARTDWTVCGLEVRVSLTSSTEACDSHAFCFPDRCAVLCYVVSITLHNTA